MASRRDPPATPVPRGATEHSAVERQKRAAAHAAADMVAAGARVGLGTGTTVAYLLPALAARGLHGLRCVATSPATERAARALGLAVVELDALDALDIAIDGADQIDPRGWLIKGRGAAHTREKIVAAAARRFVVIASAEKTVSELAPPVPVEILPFGSHTTLDAIAPTRLRNAPLSPDGNLIADYLGAVADPQRVSSWLSGAPGVIEHGLFAPSLVSDILIAHDDGVEHRRGGKDP
jgi:ribose 5-phosphate isomerase A